MCLCVYTYIYIYISNLQTKPRVLEPDQGGSKNSKSDRIWSYRRLLPVEVDNAMRWSCPTCVLNNLERSVSNCQNTIENLQIFPQMNTHWAQVSDWNKVCVVFLHFIKMCLVGWSATDSSRFQIWHLLALSFVFHQQHTSTVNSPPWVVAGG